MSSPSSLKRHNLRPTEAGLTATDTSQPGWTRRQRGKGWSFCSTTGSTLSGANRERCASLAIPPAWQSVWINPDPRGHIQAYGEDAEGRRQYIYHPDWREAADAASTPEWPRFVAGALGPTPRTASISPDVNDPGARNVSFDELRAAYREQAEGLLEGGVDLFLVETIFDTLNAKAAIFALDELMADTGERLPVILSGTVTDASGRILSGQTVTAFWHSVRHARPLAVGLNCALGAALMRPYIEELGKVAADTYISCYPNAGLPNPMSETGFDETPPVTAGLMAEFAKAGFLNIAGGCCGTTPEHIAAIRQQVSAYRPRSRHDPLFSGLLAA